MTRDQLAAYTDSCLRIYLCQVTRTKSKIKFKNKDYMVNKLNT